LFVTLLFTLFFEVSTIFSEISNLYVEKKYSDILEKIELTFENRELVLKKAQLLTELLLQYRKVSDKINSNPTRFFIKLTKLDCDYTLKERIFYELAQYYKEKGVSHYYSAVFWYKKIVENNQHKTLLGDDAYWNLFLIYKEIGAYNNALSMLLEIINTEESSYLIGSYNLYQFYDAFIEKANIEFLMGDKKKAKSTLKYYIKNYPNTDTTKKAIELLKSYEK